MTIGEATAEILTLRRILGSVVMNSGGKLEIRDEPYFGNIFVEFTREGWMSVSIDPRKEEIN